MKKLLFLVLLFAASYSVKAQDLTWYTNLDKAIEVSNQTKKPLMLFFTGSDWCYWCHRLDGEVFSKSEFTTWAKNNVILVEVDFPRKTTLSTELQTQNNKLQQFFSIQGFPTVVFVNAVKKEGKIVYDKIGTSGYIEGGPAKWLSNANGILKK